MRKLLVLALVVGLVGAFAFAGDYEKCTAGTQECLDMMVTKLKNKGMIGVKGEMKDGAFVITEFMDGSTAQAAGLQTGDVLLAVNGLEVGSDEYKEASSALTPGAVAKIKVMRGEEKVVAKVELMGMSPQQIAEYVGGHMLDHSNVNVDSDE